MGRKKTYQETEEEEEEEVMDDETIIEIMFPDGVENEEDWPNYDD